MPTTPRTRTAEPPLDSMPQAVPLEYAGKWVAWSFDGLTIMGAAERLKDAEAAAVAVGEEKPILEKVPGRWRR